MTSSTQMQRNPLQQAGRAVAVVFSLVIIAVIAFFVIDEANARFGVMAVSISIVALTSDKGRMGKLGWAIDLGLMAAFLYPAGGGRVHMDGVRLHDSAYACGGLDAGHRLWRGGPAAGAHWRGPATDTTSGGCSSNDAHRIFLDTGCNRNSGGRSLFTKTETQPTNGRKLECITF